MLGCRANSPDFHIVQSGVLEALLLKEPVHYSATSSKQVIRFLVAVAIKSLVSLEQPGLVCLRSGLLATSESIPSSHVVASCLPESGQRSGGNEAFGRPRRIEASMPLPEVVRQGHHACNPNGFQVQHACEALLFPGKDAPKASFRISGSLNDVMISCQGGSWTSTC